MSDVVVADDVELFRAAIRRRLGLNFEDAKLGFLRAVLLRRTDTLALPCAAYLLRLGGEQAGCELGALAEELTVPETYFFRNNEQFQALAERALPERMRADRSSRTLRILSAGCASGEEAYSLAIAAREAVADSSWSIAVRAVDINPAMLEKARIARYSSWALRGTSDDIRTRWFRDDGRFMLLADAVRSAATFEQRNLATADAELWAAQSYDVIFFRNVMMYFTPEHMTAAIERAAHALMPGGFLFLGHAETLRGHSSDFHLHHTHGTFYYERKRDHEPIEPKGRWAVGAPAAPDGTDSGEWINAIRASSDRIAALVPRTPAAAPG